MSGLTQPVTPLQKLQSQFFLSEESQIFQKIQRKFGSDPQKAAFSNDFNSLTPAVQDALSQVEADHPLKKLVTRGGVELTSLAEALGRLISLGELSTAYLGEAVSLALVGQYWQKLDLRLRAVQEALGHTPPPSEMPNTLETLRVSLEKMEDTIALIAWAVDFEFPEL